MIVSYLPQLVDVVVCATFILQVSSQCADYDSYCFSGLSLGHTWDQYSTQYLYEGTLNGCSYFKSIDNLYIYWASEYNVWAVTNNVNDGSALAACAESKLDDCISSKWLLAGSDGYAVDFNLQIQTCAYDNSECLAALSVNDAHCIANTDHRTSNSGLASKYHFEGCSMAQPHFQYTISPTSIVSLAWNDVLSAWFLKTYPDNAPWQTLAYCLQPELNDCSSNWHIHDTSDFVVDPLVISGLCSGCTVDYDLCIDTAASIGYDYQGRYSFTQCDANGYPVFVQYENADGGDASNAATLHFNYSEASFVLTNVNEPSVRYASCHAVSWQICNAYDLWTSDEATLSVDQCDDTTTTTTTDAPVTTIAGSTGSVATDTTVSRTDATLSTRLITTTLLSSSTVAITSPLPSLSTLPPSTTLVSSSDAAQTDPQGAMSLITIVIIIVSVIGACIVVFLAVISSVLCVNSRRRKNSYTHDLEQVQNDLPPPPPPVGPPPPLPPAQQNTQATNVMATNEDLPYAFQPGHTDASVTSPGTGTFAIGQSQTPKNFLRHFSSSNESLYADQQEPAEFEMQALNQQQQQQAVVVANIDPRRYEQWNSQQVENWLTGLESGRYRRYVHQLMSGFTNDAVPASDLPDLDQGILRVFGVDNHHDRQGLLRQLQRLRGSTIGEGGADEAEGHGTTTQGGVSSDDEGDE